MRHAHALHATALIGDVRFNLDVALRVPNDIIWDHGGLWSDNSVAMFAALYRMHFPLNAEGEPAPSQPVRMPKAPDTQRLNQDKLH